MIVGNTAGIEIQAMERYHTYTWEKFSIASSDGMWVKMQTPETCREHGKGEKVIYPVA